MQYSPSYDTGKGSNSSWAKNIRFNKIGRRETYTFIHINVDNNALRLYTNNSWIWITLLSFIKTEYRLDRKPTKTHWGGKILCNEQDKRRNSFNLLLKSNWLTGKNNILLFKIINIFISIYCRDVYILNKCLFNVM